jgi:hypothetical protein
MSGREMAFHGITNTHFFFAFPDAIGEREEERL